MLNKTPAGLGSTVWATALAGVQARLETTVASTVSSIEQTLNVLNNGTVTGWAPLTVGVAGPTPISAGVEVPFFAFDKCVQAAKFSSMEDGFAATVEPVILPRKSLLKS